MRVSLLFSLLLSVSLSAQTPVDYSRWQINDSTFEVNIGGPVMNYHNGSAWVPILNEYTADGDSVLECKTSVLQSRVAKATGKSIVTFTHRGNVYNVSQRLYGIGWLKKSTGQHLWIDSTMDWSNVSNNETYVHWANVSPGVNFAVEKSRGSVKHGIIFKPAFLDSAVTLYNQRADSLDIYLANLMIYTLSTGEDEAQVDNKDSLFTNLSWRQFKAFGKRAFGIKSQYVHVAGVELNSEDQDGYIEVKQHWKLIGDKLFCVEYVSMHELKRLHELYPANNLWHNAEVSITGSAMEVAGGRGIIASFVGYGISTVIEIWASSNRYALIRPTGIATAVGGGADITGATFRFWVSADYASPQTAEMHRCTKPWIEGVGTGGVLGGGDEGTNASNWDHNASFGWNNFGVQCANDDGTDNSTDGDGTTCTSASERDRHSTVVGSHITEGTGWMSSDIDVDLVQDWYDETIDENGFMMAGTGATDFDFHTNDGDSTPYLAIRYETSASSPTRDSLGPADIDDTWLDVGSPTFNYGITEFRVTGNTIRMAPYLMEIDVSSISAPVDVVTCSLCVRVSADNTNWFARRITTQWWEGDKDGAAPSTNRGATFNMASDGGFLEDEDWDNATSFNTGDFAAFGSAADPVVANGFHCFSTAQLAADMEMFINNDSLASWVVHCDDVTKVLHSTETTVGTPLFKPYVIVNYISAGAAEFIPRRRKVLLGGR